MLTKLLNSFLMEQLSLIPLAATNTDSSYQAYTRCGDGSCSGDCVGGCEGTPAGGW